MRGQVLVGKLEVRMQVRAPPFSGIWHVSGSMLYRLGAGSTLGVVSGSVFGCGLPCGAASSVKQSSFVSYAMVC